MKTTHSLPHGDLWRLNRIRDRSGTPQKSDAWRIVSPTCSLITSTRCRTGRCLRRCTGRLDGAFCCRSPAGDWIRNPTRFSTTSHDRLVRTRSETAIPRFWAWVNSPPTVMGIFAEALAAAMNPSVAGGNHAAVHVERQVIRWFAEMLGLPHGDGPPS